jgi:hypothetical protein
MRAEHCQSDDSLTHFETGNYGVTSTSQVEWFFVYDPEAGLNQLGKVLEELGCDKNCYPVEKAMDEETGRRRSPIGEPLSLFLERMAEKNAYLKEELGADLLVKEEVIGGRLYTGPMYIKYNCVLRAMVQEAPEFVKRDFSERLCLGNTYQTTIHAINSLIVKCSKLTLATSIYRGSANGLLPEPFWQPNKENVRGGVEGGFMSTTTERSIAVSYADTGGTPMVFEMRQGMVDRGAEARPPPKRSRHCECVRSDGAVFDACSPRSRG